MERYALDYGMRPTTIVEFGLRGDLLDPQAITASLGILPSKAWAKGDPFPGERLSKALVRPTGAWRLAAHCSKYESFEHQFSRLLDQLEALPSSTLRELVGEFSGEIGVGYSSGEHHIGFTVEQDQVRRLCDLGIALSFSLYVGLKDDNLGATSPVEGTNE